MTAVHVRALADVPECVDTLARWHHAQWSELIRDWPLAMARAELQEHLTQRMLPTTLVLHLDDELAGSVSLLEQDVPEFADLGPWLASLYVAPVHRGKGLGARLLGAAMRHAQRCGVARLYLFTPEHREFYARHGWQTMESRHLGAQPVTIMAFDTAVLSESAAH